MKFKKYQLNNAPFLVGHSRNPEISTTYISSQKQSNFSHTSVQMVQQQTVFNGNLQQSFLVKNKESASIVKCCR